jgi:hypothetical protein
MGPFAAAVRSARLDRWEIVWLRPEASIDEGSFVLTGDDQHNPATGLSYPVAEYKPGRDGTHTPVGPHEMEALGLRPEVPHFDDDLPTPSNGGIQP